MAKARELLQTGWILMGVHPNQARGIDEGPLVYVFGKLGRIES